MLCVCWVSISTIHGHPCIPYGPCSLWLGMWNLDPVGSDRPHNRVEIGDRAGISTVDKLGQSISGRPRGATPAAWKFHPCPGAGASPLAPALDPGKHKTFVQYLYNVGPTSKTLARRCTNVVQMFCVCWDSPTPPPPACQPGPRPDTAATTDWNFD